ncbi:MAG TPA: PHB depolymerase family esterase [Planctomycetaceae bacterium]|nr:PHB depolymerase family esterase [Planctomycetaceae bacterium]
MQDEPSDIFENLPPRKGPRAAPYDDSADNEPHGPSAAKVVLWVGAGCFTFVALLGLLIGLGLNAVWTIIKEDVDPGAPAEMVEYNAGDPLPEPPLQLPRPPAPSECLTATDLAQIDPQHLEAAAQHYYQIRDYETAIQCQYLSVIKTDRGRYNLACYYARAEDVPAALYWLQAGAKDEDSNAEWTSRDSDLIKVRKDPRWPTLWRYLSIYQQYWEATNLSETSLVLPHGSDLSRPLPIFIGLHGMAANASSFVDRETYQVLADKMGVAFLGVSGTLARGKRNFVWSEDPVRDLARIDAALKETSDRVTPAEGQIVLFGFSEGGWVAAELAASYPQRFAGAIILSPGSRLEQPTPEMRSEPEHRRQGIVVVCGAAEHSSTVAYTERCAALFDKLGARVYKKLYPGMNTHSFPPNYLKNLPLWGKFILSPTVPARAIDR